MCCLMRLTELHLHPDTPCSQRQLTPAHLAAQASHPRCLKWLVLCGIRLDRQVNDMTATHPMSLCVPCSWPASASSCSRRVWALTVTSPPHVSARHHATWQRSGATPSVFCGCCSHRQMPIVRYTMDRVTFLCLDQWLYSPIACPCNTFLWLRLLYMYV